MDLNMELCGNFGILKKNLEIIFFDFDHEIGHGIENKPYI